MKIFESTKDSLNYTFDYNPNETKFLQNDIKNKENISIDDIRRISLWKLDRVIDVSEETMLNLQKIANEKNITIESALVIKTIEMLTGSNGIGFPMASAILKFLRPDIFPIIDVRAYRALYGKKIYSSQYTIEKYIEYVKELNRLSTLLNRSLSDMDEQLYCFDKENNGKI